MLIGPQQNLAVLNNMFVENYQHENIYFWSDLHLGHDRDFIYGPRGFHDVELHDSMLAIRLWQIPTDAVVWLLGDIIFGINAEERLEKVLSNYPGKEIVLMPGNHYSGFKQLRRKYGRKFELNGTLIRLVSNLEEIRVKSQAIVLSHYPLMSWNGIGHGAWMLHGHVHGRIKTSLPTEYDGGKILDVGVESCPEPLSFAEIKEIMDKKPFKQVDHHGPT